MTLPNLTKVPSLGINLPPLPPYQKWAYNRDTNSLVLIEFVYEKINQQLQTQNILSKESEDSISLLTTTLQQSSLLINNQLQTLENRMNVLETLVNSVVPPTVTTTGTV